MLCFGTPDILLRAIYISAFALKLAKSESQESEGKWKPTALVVAILSETSLHVQIPQISLHVQIS